MLVVRRGRSTPAPSASVAPVNARNWSTWCDTDVDEDAAVARRVEEPLGPVLQVQRVRPEPDRVHHLADRARARRAAAPRSSRGCRAARRTRRASGGRSRLARAHLVELRGRRDAGLVGARRPCRRASPRSRSSARSPGIAAVTTMSTSSAYGSVVRGVGILRREPRPDAVVGRDDRAHRRRPLRRAAASARRRARDRYRRRRYRRLARSRGAARVQLAGVVAHDEALRRRRRSA